MHLEYRSTLHQTDIGTCLYVKDFFSLFSDTTAQREFDSPYRIDYSQVYCTELDTKTFKLGHKGVYPVQVNVVTKT